MRIYVPVPESYAADLKDGMKATLDLPEYPDRKFDATIITNSHAIDEKSRTLLVELIADNKDDSLSPGAFTRVNFQIPPDANRITIPAGALLFHENSVEVATLGRDNRTCQTVVGHDPVFMLSAATVSRGRFDGFPIVSERPLFALTGQLESS
jgi:multidrug efflux pump subunit AcrA (membrane-fusion protein)